MTEKNVVSLENAARTMLSGEGLIKRSLVKRLLGIASTKTIKRLESTGILPKGMALNGSTTYVYPASGVREAIRRLSAGAA